MILRQHSLLQGADFSYRRVLEYAVSQGWCLPSIKIQRAQNNYLKRRKTLGQFAVDDILYVFVNDACDINFSRINWVNPGSFTLSVNGTLTFTSLVGITGNGSTGYLGTGYQPTIDAVHVTAAECGVEWYVIGNSSANARYDWGNSANSLFRCNLRNAGGTTQFSLYDGAVNVAGPASTAGHFLAYRDSVANDGRIYQNGANTGIATTTANAFGGEVYIFRHLADYSNRGGKMFAHGGDYEPYVTSAYNNFNDYLNAI